jgi:dTDP-4-amino-4,6-dideoxygalactose transaminase
MPMHRLPFLKDFPHIGGGLQADLSFEHAVSLPSGAGLNGEEIEEVISAVKKGIS